MRHTNFMMCCVIRWSTLTIYPDSRELVIAYFDISDIGSVGNSILDAHHAQCKNWIGRRKILDQVTRSKGSSAVEVPSTYHASKSGPASIGELMSNDANCEGSSCPSGNSCSTHESAIIIDLDLRVVKDRKVEAKVSGAR